MHVHADRVQLLDAEQPAEVPYGRLEEIDHPQRVAVPDVLGGEQPPVLDHRSHQVLLRAHPHRLTLQADLDGGWHVPPRLAKEEGVPAERTHYRVVTAVDDIPIVQQVQFGLQVQGVAVPQDHWLTGNVGRGHHQRVALEMVEQQMLHLRER